MKINKIVLKNYRNHALKEFTFDEGINLILGPNGSGKSSIVEALGVALFNAEPRNGNLSDAIGVDGKNATITVDFIGADDNNYIIERKIGQGSYARLYLNGEPGNRAETMDEVYEKMRSLAGIKKNEKKIFQNIITASQNKFVNIFLETPGEREKIFNEIFDTEIYRKMSEDFLKKFGDSRNSALQIKQNLSLEKSRYIVDASELEQIRLDLTEKRDVIEKEFAGLKNTQKELSIEKSALEKIQNEIGVLNKDVANKKENYENIKREIEQNSNNLKESENALKIVRDNKSNYDLYEIKSAERAKIFAEISKLEKDKIVSDELKREISELSIKIAESQEKIKGKEDTLAEKKEEIAEKKEEFELFERDFESKRAVTKDKSIYLEKLASEYLEFSDLRTAIIDLKKENDKLEALIENFKDKLVDPDCILQKLELLKKKQNELQLNKKTMDTLSLDIETYRTRLNDLRETKTKLSSGYCPYLNEECLNIKNDVSPDKYFESKENEFTVKIDDLNNEYLKFKGLSSEIDKNIGDISEQNRALEENAQIKAQISDNQYSIELNNKNIEIDKLKITNLLSQSHADLCKYLDNENLDEINLKLSGNISSLKRELELNEAELSKMQKELDRKRADITGEDKYVENLNDEIIKLKESLDENSAKKNNLIEEKDNYDKIISDLPQKKEELNAINSELQELKNSYDLYMSNFSKSAELEKYKNKIIEYKDNLLKTEAHIKKCETEILNKNKIFSVEKLNELTDLIALNDNKIENTLSSLSATKIELNNIVDKIEKNICIIKEKETLDNEIKRLDLTLDVTKKLRTKLNEMGKLVAARLIEKIEQISTNNFRNITGRNEEIVWKNSSTESYAVYLRKNSDAANETRCDILSGGKQVAVALSIRAALASAFTATNLAIFDEPTINLDSERKEALAENLSEIFKNLEQTIIITHDDTFRETAQKVITIP